MTTSLCLIGAADPSLRSLAAERAGATAVSSHMGCSWTTASYSVWAGSVVTPLDVHAESGGNRPYRDQQADANISSGSQFKPMLYANPLPL